MADVIDPQKYQALVIRRALLFYVKTGQRVNRNYTPSNMVRMATQITGKTFKPRDYLGAAEALQAWVDDKRPPWE